MNVNMNVLVAGAVGCVVGCASSYALDVRSWLDRMGPPPSQRGENGIQANRELFEQVLATDSHYAKKAFHCYNLVSLLASGSVAGVVQAELYVLSDRHLLKLSWIGDPAMGFARIYTDVESTDAIAISHAYLADNRDAFPVGRLLFEAWVTVLKDDSSNSATLTRLTDGRERLHVEMLPIAPTGRSLRSEVVLLELNSGMSVRDVHITFKERDRHDNP